MQTRKLTLACPICGSGEVFYSCTPGCCFNHVCGNCGATFEPATRRTGLTVRGIVPPDPLPDATDPTTECCACNSTAVYVLDNGTAACEKCGAGLEIEITEVSKA